MAMRNFWVEGNIDGRETVLSGGPRAKDGGMNIKIFQRSEGQSRKAVEVNCYVGSDGETLITHIQPSDKGCQVEVLSNGTIRVTSKR